MATQELPPAASPSHLTEVLRRAATIGDGRVTGVTVEKSTPTVLSMIHRLRLTFDDVPPGVADSLILKAALPGGPLGGWGRSEVDFYRAIAPHSPAGLVPRCYDAHRDDADQGTWHLLLEDLTDTHATPQTWPLPPSLPQCEGIVRTFARFHAAWWDHASLGVTAGKWGPIDPDGPKRFAAQVERFGDVLGDRLSDERRAFYRRFVDCMPRLAERYHSHRNMTIVHGDSHVWNCFLPKDGGRDFRLFDWDAWRVDTASDDLAYMMALHWHPDLRRQRERHLLDVYHAELLEHGVRGYERASLQADYRLSVLWATTKPVWQQAHGIPPWIWWAHLDRIHLAVDDLGCRDLLD
jgi:Ecdysteroid kinase-like family